MPDNETTIVIFRKWRRGGTILALFPAIPTDYAGKYCEAYEHVGQHGGADYSGCIKATVPAKPEEYEDLKRELEGAPYHYKLVVRHRATAKQHNVCRETARSYK